MNTLSRYETRWNPFKEMEDLQNRLSSLFSRVGAPNRDEQEQIAVAEWAPRVDILEDETGYLVKAELPELKKEEVKVTVENGILTISGERKLEQEEKGRKYHRIERAYGRFVRSFAVPDNADPSQVNAEFKEGMLKVHLAKNEKAKPRSIEVKIA